MNIEKTTIEAHLKIKNYKIEELIGKGDTCEVYRAHDKKKCRYVAVKVFEIAKLSK